MTTKLLEGIICIDKRLLNRSIWARSDYGHAWITLLLLANDKDRRVPLRRGVVDVRRGQVVHAKRTLQKRFGRGPKWLNSFLDACIELDMIKVETCPDWTVITILNYNAYNDILLQRGAGFSGTDSDRGILAVRRPDVEIGIKQPVTDSVYTDDLIEVEGYDFWDKEPDEFQRFCKSFKDPARGITKIPPGFAHNWRVAKSPLYWWLPRNWKVALSAAFLEAHAKGEIKLSRNGRDVMELKDAIDSEMEKGHGMKGPDIASLLAELEEFGGKGFATEYLEELWGLGMLAVKAA